MLQRACGRDWSEIHAPCSPRYSSNPLLRTVPMNCAQLPTPLTAKKGRHTWPGACLEINLSDSFSFVSVICFLDQLTAPFQESFQESGERRSPESLIRAAWRFINSPFHEINPSASEVSFLCHQFFLPSKFKGCHRRLLTRPNPSIKFWFVACGYISKIQEWNDSRPFFAISINYVNET